MSGFLEPLDSQEEAEQLAVALAVSAALQTGVGPAVGPAPEVLAASEASFEDESSDAASEVLVLVSEGAATGSSVAEEPAERPTLRGALAAGEAFAATEESAQGVRFYAVWVAPGVDQSILGVHVSTGSLGWYELIRFLPRGRYSYFDGTRLRRYPTFEAAHLAYERGSVGTSNALLGATLRW
jgi:hypothetical protein